MQFSPPLVTFFLCAALAAAAQTSNRTAPPQASQPKAGLQPSDSAPTAASTPNGQLPDLQALITGLEAAQRTNHAHMVPFTVTREYLLFSGDDKQPKGTVIAEVRFQPPTSKTWEIKKTSGSARAEKVVKSVLEREVKYARDGKIALGRADYDFRFAGTGEADRRPCYILQLGPKRDDGSLLRGRIWVDRDTYLIHRFEGEPAKSPSWWIKDRKLSTQYSDMGGIWLPTSSKGVADVRVFGPHTMTERTLDYRASRPVLEGPAAELARLQPRAARPYRPSPVAAAGVVILGR
jgi:hypothetical protein